MVFIQAKLPRGIKNIRPHLENVDNVPLLVSLFTDCSAEATREMLTIMQSYGEIVVCIGSSASCSNVESFIEADCSIAIEPLYPQVRIIAWKLILIELLLTLFKILFKILSKLNRFRFAKIFLHTRNQTYWTIAIKWCPMMRFVINPSGLNTSRHDFRELQPYHRFTWAANWTPFHVQLRFVAKIPFQYSVWSSFHDDFRMAFGIVFK